jgi:hypothetical protein
MVIEYLNLYDLVLVVRAVFVDLSLLHPCADGIGIRDC